MSCKYCDNSFIFREDKEYICHRPFHIRDNNHKRIRASSEKPLMYLREEIVPETHLWQIVMELNNENRDIIETPVIYCPRCGEKLVCDNLEKILNEKD